MNINIEPVDREALILQQLAKGNTGVIAGVPWQKLPTPVDMVQVLKQGSSRINDAMKKVNNGDKVQLQERLRQIGEMISQIQTPVRSGAAAAETRQSFRDDYGRSSM